MNISILFFAVAVGLKVFLYIDSARNWDYLFTLLYTYLGSHNYTHQLLSRKVSFVYCRCAALRISSR